MQTPDPPPWSGPERRLRLRRARLYLIVTPDEAGRWEGATRAALATGCVGVLQLRAKGLGDPEVAALAVRMRALAEEADVPWLLNDRPDLALRLRADGAHVGEDDLAPPEARRLLGPDLLLGVSTHDEAEVRAAANGPADYAGLGPCFPTETKRLSRVPGGADLVRRCLPAARGFPVFPIGGITPANAGALADAGATRLAVGAAVLEAPDPAAAVRALSRALGPARAPDPGKAGRTWGGSPPGG